MNNRFQTFEHVSRLSGQFSDESFAPPDEEHPFDARNIFPKLPPDVRDLFDNGHYAQSTFEAFKFLESEVRRHSGLTSDSGKALMMNAFNENSPKIRLTTLATLSDKNEQEGYKFIFAGSTVAIRNPRGHEHSVREDPDECLDFLSLVSMLLRRLSRAGLK